MSITSRSGVISRLLDDRTTAEDVCHESFVKVLLHWDDCDQAANTRGWLYRIAKDTAYDHLRRQRRVVMTPLTDTYEARGRSSTGDPIHQCRAGVGGVEPPARPLSRATLAPAAAEYPLHTSATTLGCNVNTIKTRLRRARLRSRQLYGATEESGCESG